MSRKIRTYEELRAEKKRLESLLKAQKELIRHDVAAIQQELEPVKKLVRFAGKFTSRDRSDMLMTGLSDFAIDLVVKKGILSRSGWLTRLIVPYLTKNFSSHYLTDFKDLLMEKLGQWLSSTSHEDAENSSASENGVHEHQGPSDQPMADTENQQ